jgi:8-oxo-dGTP pyrophosphatase MutT (NUDIX family)
MALTPWDSLATEFVVDNPWYRLRRDTVRLPSGRIVDDYFVAERDDVVLVFAVTPDDHAVFVHQWKQGRRAFYTELPGGMCDPGEEAVATAGRELLEETGYACESLHELGRFEPDPTKISNAIVAFLGLGARQVAEPVWDEQEELEVRLLPVGGLHAAVRAREITPAGTVATIYRALDELGRITVS